MPPLERAWTPQLRPYLDDAEVFEQEPFATVFADHTGGTITRRGGEQLWQKLDHILSLPIWVGLNPTVYSCLHLPRFNLLMSGSHTLWAVKLLPQGRQMLPRGAANFSSMFCGFVTVTTGNWMGKARHWTFSSLSK